MYVVPQSFLFSAMRSIIGFQQQWMMILTSELGIGTRLFQLVELGALT
jgi:hypothetical protein